MVFLVGDNKPDLKKQRKTWTLQINFLWFCYIDIWPGQFHPHVLIEHICCVAWFSLWAISRLSSLFAFKQTCLLGSTEAPVLLCDVNLFNIITPIPISLFRVSKYFKFTRNLIWWTYANFISDLTTIGNDKVLNKFRGVQMLLSITKGSRTKGGYAILPLSLSFSQ